KWGNLTASEPSRFIDEIDPKYLEMPAQNERGAFSSGHYVRPGTPPRARQSGQPDGNRRSLGLDQGHEDRAASKPIHGRERSAPGLGRPAAPPAGNPSPAPRPAKLKRISNAGAPLEATNSLGGGSSDIEEGMTVTHERFGKGKVLKVEGKAPDLKATVFFPSAGQKQLLLRFAKLTVVEG
ncbi:MAG TPA: hypothetical protein PLR96_05055, partial [Flavobacteriales bacterium]|nr:hypothetical protein [Flavobacteriales bacterium]